MASRASDHETDFDVNSSPVVHSQAEFLYPSALATPSPFRVADSDLFSDSCLFDIPFPDLSLEPPEPYTAPKAVEEAPQARPKPKPCVFQPFTSVGSIELTVQTLRKEMNQRVKRSQSAVVSLKGY